jgi:peptidoglycan hydrolase-like protein with peptidoglycan-binding domain
MNNTRILQIIREETAHQEGLLFEGMTYVPQRGYRNNQLLEVYGPNGKQLITEGGIDTIQSVLDYAGFIPVIGDALDAINALIYFIRKKFMDGIFSIVAIIPGVGTPLKLALSKLYNKIGKPLVEIFKTLTKSGKGAANALFKLISNSSNFIKGLAKPIFDLIKKGASKIASALGKVSVKGFNNKIMDFSWGWVGLPNWAVKSLDGIVGQLKAFFTHMATPPSAALHVTSKKAERTIHGLLPHEEEEAKKVYKTDKVDKEKYPTEDDFIEAQIELKNLKPEDLQKKMGEELNKQSIKNVLAWMKKKEGNEIKLWSKYDAVVKLVQKAVGVKPDGSFGTGTEKAVKIAQKKHGLSPDGVVGPETWKKLTATNFRT